MARILGIVRIIGLIAVISYMAVILFIWIYSNLKGFVYFSAGEPVLVIKYPEWILGFIGIFVSIDYLRKALSEAGEANAKRQVANQAPDEEKRRECCLERANNGRINKRLPR